MVNISILFKDKNKLNAGEQSGFVYHQIIRQSNILEIVLF